MVGGKLIPKGSVMRLLAAGRQPRPAGRRRGDGVDLAHASSSHLAFGYGFHRCVGAELARMELQAGVPGAGAAVPGDAAGGRRRRTSTTARSASCTAWKSRAGHASAEPRLAGPGAGRSRRSPAPARRSARRGRRAGRPRPAWSTLPASTCRRRPSRADSSSRSPAWAMSPPTTITSGLSRLVTVGQAPAQVQAGVLEDAQRRDVALLGRPR